MALPLRAFVIALALIFPIIVAQFNSISTPFIIGFAVLFSTGVFLGLVVFRQDFVIIMTMIGIILLAGVVVNNAIVLIDYTNLLIDRRKEELWLSEDDLLLPRDFALPHPPDPFAPGVADGHHVGVGFVAPGHRHQRRLLQPAGRIRRQDVHWRRHLTSSEASKSWAIIYGLDVCHLPDAGDRPGHDVVPHPRPVQVGQAAPSDLSLIGAHHPGWWALTSRHRNCPVIR